MTQNFKASNGINVINVTDNKAKYRQFNLFLRRKVVNLKLLRGPEMKGKPKYREKQENIPQGKTKKAKKKKKGRQTLVVKAYKVKPPPPLFLFFGEGGLVE